MNVTTAPNERSTSAGSVPGGGAPAEPSERIDRNEPADLMEAADSIEAVDSIGDSADPALDTDLTFAPDGSVNDDNGEILLNDALNLLVTLDENLESLQRRADAHGNV